jgi:membrane fusion protein (multidrug efflux system)
LKTTIRANVPGLCPWRAAALLTATALLFACGKSAPPGPPQMPPPEVNAVAVHPREIPIHLEYVGQSQGIRDAEVRPRVSGILQSWNYTEGSRVRAGQSLFTIDPAPFQVQVAHADADLATAQARLTQAKRDVERLKPLLDQGMVSQKAYDDALAAMEVGAAQVQGAQAALAEAKLNLEYTRVQAPISGITSRALVSQGSLVEAQRTLLTVVSQIDPIRVIFSMAEAERLKLAAEATAGRLRLPKANRFVVTVSLPDGSSAPEPGVVDFSDVRVNPDTGTTEFRAVLPNPGQRLRPGQFVRVQLQGAQYVNALAVPQRAVLEAPQGKMVFVVDEKGLAQPRPVQVGNWAGEEWVITSGLNAGDRVIVDGVMKIRPGAPVTIAQTQPPASGSPPAAAKP